MIHAYYRISDTGYKKEKPDYINNRNCLMNFVKIFDPVNLNIIADSVSTNTLEMIQTTAPKAHIQQVAIGHGAGTFNLAIDHAISTHPDNDIIYFVENDYLHKPKAPDILMEGFELGADFVTLYDHPDKYMDPSIGGNPFCQGGAENTRVYLGQSCHWKITNSTTMTFAAKISTLKQTINTIKKWTSSSHPHDFQMFLELGHQQHILISSIPGFATHGESKWLAPLSNWEIYL
jgi:hypothetical protein